MGSGKRANEKAVGEKVKERECLKCEKKFNSYSKHNRICLDCKNSPNYTKGMFYEREEK